MRPPDDMPVTGRELRPQRHGSACRGHAEDIASRTTRATTCLGHVRERATSIGRGSHGRRSRSHRRRSRRQSRSRRKSRGPRRLTRRNRES